MPGTGIYPDFYEHLPGSIVELKDGVRNMPSETRRGKNIYLIGTAVDGPVMEPITPRSYDEAERIFGGYADKATRTFNGATLMRGYERALRAGADNVTLLRISGKHATGKLLLNKEVKTKTYQSREYAGKYAGNIETVIDLGIEIKDGYDDVYVTDVSVYANGQILNAYKYTVNSSAGTITLNEDVTSSGAEIEIYYSVVDVKVYSVSGETPVDMTGEGVQFKLANNNLVEGSEVVNFEVEGEEKPTFTIDYQAGIISLSEPLREGESFTVDYDWKELTESKHQKSAIAEGTEYFVDLQHTADASKPMIVTINGVEIPSSRYKVNYTSYDTSRVFIEPGLGDLNADVYINYYWSKEELIEPEIELRSIYGGKLYNKVKFEVQDILYEDREGNKKTKVSAGENLNPLSASRLKLANEYIVPSDDFSITITRADDSVSTLTVGNGDIYVDWAKGIVIIQDSVFNVRPNDKSIKAGEYEYYHVASKVLRLYKPEEKMIDNTDRVLEFYIGDVINTIGELVAAVNNHPRNNVVRMSIPEEYVAISAMELKTPDKKILDDGSIAKSAVYLAFGEDGIDVTKEEIYDLLEGSDERPGAYEIILEDDNVDIVVPLGVYADDVLASEFKRFDQQLANFCAQAFYRNNEIRGIIGMKPLDNPSRINVINRVKELQSFNANYYLTNRDGHYITDREGSRIDIGKFISIVAHDFIIPDNKLAVNTPENGAVLYAAVCSMLDKTNSPTNEQIPGARLAYNLSNAQANALAANKLVVFMNRGGVPRVASAVTCAQPGSGWTRYHTVDIVFNIIDLLRRVYDPYIGQGNTLEKRNALDSDIMDALKKEDTIVDFNYRLIQSPTDRLMGRLIIELELVPIGEMQKIHTVVSINAQLD